MGAVPNYKKYSEAVKQMDINKSGGVFLQGLENRRVKERKIWNEGVYENN